MASFCRFALELMAFGGPPELVQAAQQAALDEAEHAKLGFTIASELAAHPVGPGALPLGDAVAIETDLGRFAASVAIDACVNETLAVLVAAEQLAQATDPAVRAALEIVVRDETRHAELAFRTLAWAVSSGGDPVRRAVRTALAQHRLPEDSGSKVVAPSHGLLAPEVRQRVMQAGWEQVVRPCLASVLAPAAREHEGSAVPVRERPS
jgi:hypothetical protein